MQMKTKRTQTLLAVSVAAALLLPLQTHAQLGGLGKIAGVGGTVTVESLNADVVGGWDFFHRAYTNFAAAVCPAEQAAAILKPLAAVDAQTNPAEAQAATKEVCEQINKAVDERIKEGRAYTEEEKKLVKAGQTEAAKGVAKWAAVGVSLAMAAKSQSSDEKLAAAIPAAREMIKELPDIKSMLSTINKLNKIKKGA
jgi:hypothetical protein